MAHGLKPKLHVNQLNSIGGIETGIKLNALSLDHLETMTEKDIKDLSDSMYRNTFTNRCFLFANAFSTGQEIN